jgi:hypothetical protein
MGNEQEKSFGRSIKLALLSTSRDYRGTGKALVTFVACSSDFSSLSSRLASLFCLTMTLKPNRIKLSDRVISRRTGLAFFFHFQSRMTKKLSSLWRAKEERKKNLFAGKRKHVIDEKPWSRGSMQTLHTTLITTAKSIIARSSRKKSCCATEHLPSPLNPALPSSTSVCVSIPPLRTLRTDRQSRQSLVYFKSSLEAVVL